MSEPGSPEHRQWCVASLRHALQRVALEPSQQVAQFPVFVIVADELALDLNHWIEVCRAWKYIEGEIVERLGALDGLLGSMSGPEQAVRWTKEALARDSGWQQARAMARDALRIAGWSQEVPPRPEEDGTTYVAAAPRPSSRPRKPWWRIW